MKKIRYILIICLLLILSTIGFFFYQINLQPDFSGQKEFVIQKGETVGQIGGHLFAEDIITSPTFFKLYLMLHGQEGSLQAGTYILTPMSIKELSQILIQGKVDNEIAIQLTEGQTLNDLADILLNKKIITDKKELLDLAKINNFKNKYSFLNDINNNSLEGFLFPDTYQIYKDSSAEDVLKKMLDNFNDKLTSALQTEIKAQGKNLYDILKMASILEREVQTEADMKVVAGILWKRTNSNMALQVDSSLKYIIGANNSASLTLNELAIDSLYNTYKYQGLPPTPIGNPGTNAIRAAIYPEKSDYWYYLSAKNSGETIFAKTYDEHKQNIQKYLK